MKTENKILCKTGTKEVVPKTEWTIKHKVLLMIKAEGVLVSDEEENQPFKEYEELMK